MRKHGLVNRTVCMQSRLGAKAGQACDSTIRDASSSDANTVAMFAHDRVVGRSSTGVYVRAEAFRSHWTAKAVNCNGRTSFA